MPRHTVIENGTVVNIIMCVDDFDPGAGRTLGPDGGKIGDTWNGSTYTSQPQQTPPPTSSDVSSERDRRIALGSTITISDNRTFTVQTRNETDFRNLNGLVSKAIVMTMMGDSGTLVFRDADNTDQTLTAAQMIEVGSLVAAKVDAIYKASWTIKGLDPIPSDYADNARWPG